MHMGDLTNIHDLDEKQHIVIGTILRKYPEVKLNENKNGIMVNTSTIPKEAADEINQYLEYLNKQQSILQKIENETEECKQLIIK